MSNNTQRHIPPPYDWSSVEFPTSLDIKNNPPVVILGHGEDLCIDGKLDIKSVPEHCVYITFTECAMPSFPYKFLKEFFKKENLKYFNDPIKYEFELILLFGEQIHIHHKNAKKAISRSYVDSSYTPVSISEYLRNRKYHIDSSGIVELTPKIVDKFKEDDFIIDEYHDFSSFYVGSIFPNYNIFQENKFRIKDLVNIYNTSQIKQSEMFKKRPGIYFSPICRNVNKECEKQGTLRRIKSQPKMIYSIPTDSILYRDYIYKLVTNCVNNDQCDAIIELYHKFKSYTLEQKDIIKRFINRILTKSGSNKIIRAILQERYNNNNNKNNNNETVKPYNSDIDSDINIESNKISKYIDTLEDKRNRYPNNPYIYIADHIDVYNTSIKKNISVTYNDSINDKENIYFKINDKYFMVSRTSLNNSIENYENLYFKCIKIVDKYPLVDEVKYTTPYIFINNNYLVYFVEVKGILGSKLYNTYHLEELKKIKYTTKYESIIQKDTGISITGKSVNITDLDHCQKGSEKILYKIVPFYFTDTPPKLYNNDSNNDDNENNNNNNNNNETNNVSLEKVDKKTHKKRKSSRRRKSIRKSRRRK